jgi:4-amino-4-deoxy-L-arabinose transferase-like glycosyltransferase
MALLYWGKCAFESKFFFPLLAGICFGLALFAKSFAYIAPATFALGLYYWRWRQWSIPKTLTHDLYKVCIAGILALGVFALWFVFDPNPEAVWKEFVLGENAGKFAARNSSYLLDLLRGSDSVWLLLFTTLANAGLFTFVLISALWQCWRGRRFLSLEEVLLLLLIVAFLIVFTLPSQRSGRYLLPVMPAFAALIAIHWERLPLWGFRIALLLQILALSLLLWVGISLQFSGLMEEVSTWIYSYCHWILMAGSLLIVLVGLLRRNYSKTLALVGCFLTYCALTSSLAPLEGQLGRYSAATIAQVQGKDIWVPCDYRAKDEEYRLLLPGTKLHGYLAKDATDIKSLTSAYSLVAVYAALGSAPVLCDSCEIVGKRMEMRARHSHEEIMEMLQGQVSKHLFVNEYLVATSVAAPVITPDLANVKDVCR